MTWPDELREWAGRLVTAGVPSPDADVRWLVADVLHCRPAEVILASPPTTEQLDRIDALVRRRERREPLQHILGTAPFLDLELAVGPGVFVPRPETEVMADHVIGWLDRHGSHPATVVDLGTGSGALALAIACHVPGSQVVAVERSDDAASYARRNIESLRHRLHRAGSQVRLVQADLTAAGTELRRLEAAVDAVVSNPPYVPTDAIPRDPEVRDHDPPAALYGGRDGLDVVRHVVAVGTDVLRPGGLLAIEHGDEQGGADGVPGLIGSAAAFADVLDHRDLAGKPRFTTARRR